MKIIYFAVVTYNQCEIKIHSFVYAINILCLFVELSTAC